MATENSEQKKMDRKYFHVFEHLQESFLFASCYRINFCAHYDVQNMKNATCYCCHWKILPKKCGFDERCRFNNNAYTIRERARVPARSVFAIIIKYELNRNTAQLTWCAAAGAMTERDCLQGILSIWFNASVCLIADCLKVQQIGGLKRIGIRSFKQFICLILFGGTTVFTFPCDLTLKVIEILALDAKYA